MSSLDAKASLLAAVSHAAVLLKLLKAGGGCAGGGDAAALGSSLYPTCQWAWTGAYMLLLSPVPLVWGLCHRSSWVRWRQVWHTLYIPHSFLLGQLVM